MQVHADPNVIKLWSTRTKCWMCKHRFSKPLLLPVQLPQRGVLQPHFNVEILFHVNDTHGIPPEAVVKMVSNSVYGIENTLQSVYGLNKETIHVEA
jgi:hypothetical protein